MQRFVFVRIGWMEYYAGSLPGDDRPVRGGEYNEDEIGHEVCNFRKYKDSLYGYFEPPSSEGYVRLDRIDPVINEDAELIDDVLVVFIATKPEGGQFVVGWYNHATVFGEWQEPVWRNEGEYNDIYPLLTTRFVNGLLLPLDHRTHQVPSTGPNRFGEKNIFYSHEGDGTPRNHAWINDALNWINTYAGPNLLTT